MKPRIVVPWLGLAVILSMAPLPASAHGSFFEFGYTQTYPVTGFYYPPAGFPGGFAAYPHYPVYFYRPYYPYEYHFRPYPYGYYYPPAPYGYAPYGYGYTAPGSITFRVGKFFD